MQNTTEYVRDVEGYMVNPEAWNDAVARELAEEEGLELTRDYWPVLRFMHDYWLEHKVAPDVRHVMKFLAQALAIEKKAAKQHLFKLFPYGYVKQACKIAGMQRPRVWSTG